MPVPSAMVPRALRARLEGVGRATLLFGAVLRVVPKPRAYAASALQQAYWMGVHSLPLVLVMAVMGGAVIGLQANSQMVGGVPPWIVGSAVAAAVLTEIGPVLTAMVLVGRIGASIAAELATMKVTEQIDALYAMARDPVVVLVVPRVVAGLLVLPPLVILADAAGVLSGWIVGVNSVDGLTTGEFVYGMRYYFRPIALIYSVLKAAAFGVTITFLACYVGLEGGGSAEGVGRTTTSAVVITTLAIMFLDVVLMPVLKAF